MNDIDGTIAGLHHPHLKFMSAEELEHQFKWSVLNHANPYLRYLQELQLDQAKAIRCRRSRGYVCRV